MSSVQVTITQLPAAGPITGTESVPIVQNGQTVQTTTAAIAASPSQFQTFLTVNQEPTLPNSRRLAVQTGLGLTDNGPLSTYSLALNGASGSLEGASTGIVAKTGSTTVTGRTLTASGLGLSITNGNGVSGNPTFSLSGLPLSLANIASNGILTSNSGSVNVRSIQGTANEIGVVNGDAVAGNPVISMVSNPVIPGTGAMRVPVGTTAQQPAGSNGLFRFNDDTQTFDGYSAGQWRQFSVTGGVTTFSAGSTGFSPVSATGGAVTLAGVLNAANGGTGQSSFTSNGLLYGNGSLALGVTAAGTTGQVLVGNTGSAPTWSAATSVAVTSINFNTTGLTPNAPTAGAVTVSGTLVAANGGTGYSSYSNGDVLYASGSGTLTKLAIGSAGHYWSSSGTAPQWTAPAALTKIDDTNVTLTLGGSASTALLNAASLTLGWTGQLAVGRGGTGAASFTANGVLYGNTTSAVQVTAAGTTGQVLVGNTGGAPSWSAATSVAVTSLSFGTTGLTPSVATQGAITVAGTLVAANGGTGLSSYAAGDIVYASGTTTLAKLGLGTQGQVLKAGASAPEWGAVSGGAF
jgi:hypothetical protein